MTPPGGTAPSRAALGAIAPGEAPSPLRRSRRVSTPDWGAEGFDHESWRRSAACNDVDTATFFFDGPAGKTRLSTARAKAVCAPCPVRGACLDFAISTRQEFGVWGGLDEEERRRVSPGRSGVVLAARTASPSLHGTGQPGADVAEMP